jgi:hypothetical protein
MGGTTHTTTRSRVSAVGERIDEQIQREIAENRKPDKPAEQMIIGIDELSSKVGVRRTEPVWRSSRGGST